MHFKINFITAGLRFVVFAAALATAISAQAAAYQVVVHYADLGISSVAGARALLGRLKSAARQVCCSTPDIADLRSLGAYKAFLRGSLEQAIATIDEPAVSSLYYELAGTPR